MGQFCGQLLNGYFFRKKNMETNSLQHKINSILNELAYGNFLAEDGYARDYCKYCRNEYGNYYKRGFDKQSTQVNHEPDCLHRLAVEILEQGNK
jgi:hypothetical protein